VEGTEQAPWEYLQQFWLPKSHLESPCSVSPAVIGCTGAILQVGMLATHVRRIPSFRRIYCRLLHEDIVAMFSLKKR
jgi:hypothetical protein